MNSKTIIQPPTISKRVKIAAIGGITIMSALIFVAIVAYCYNYYPNSITPGIEFTMRQGDKRAIKDSDNLVLELSRIDDGRCPTDGSVSCIWQGEIHYVFRVDDKEIILDSVADFKDGEKVGDFSIHFISGDEKSGVFVLQKD